MILRKMVFIKSKLCWCLANILLHRQLFETCVETLLNTMFRFDESPPGRSTSRLGPRDPPDVVSVVGHGEGNPLSSFLITFPCVLAFFLTLSGPRLFWKSKLSRVGVTSKDAHYKFGNCCNTMTLQPYLWHIVSVFQQYSKQSPIKI
jgi:hypothetical protein